MKLEFDTSYIKECLNTPTDIFSTEVDKDLCAIPITVKGEDIILVMTKEKVETAYNKSISEQKDYVLLDYESPTDEEIKAKGFKQEGDFLVPDN